MQALAEGALLRKLGTLVALSAQDVELVGALPMHVTRVARHRDVLSAGQRPDFVYVVLSGWAARYGMRADGSRRITGFLLPGDFCGIHAVSDAAMDHSIVALTECEVGRIHRPAIAAAVERSEALGQALWRAKLIDESILRQWLLNSADAFQAIGHLLCELHARAQTMGLAEGGRCHVPLTQEHLADAIGITSVHTNRVMQRLRAEQLLEFSHGELFIPDVEALRRACSFDGRYLHPAMGPGPIEAAA